MTDLFARAIAAVRALLGLNDSSENRLHASHGWLLPSSREAHARALESALVLAPVPVTPSPIGRRR